MEEFQDLLDPALVALMKESMYNTTIGDGYRVGGLANDNCEYSSFGTGAIEFINILEVFPVYSNPWYGSSVNVILNCNT